MTHREREDHLREWMILISDRNRKMDQVQEEIGKMEIAINSIFDEFITKFKQEITDL